MLDKLTFSQMKTKFQIEEVWKYRMGSFSIPLTKGLPYDIFMKQIIFELMEGGQLNQLQKKWEDSQPDCGVLHRSGNALGWQKIMTVFVIIIMGILMAFVTLVIEKIYHHNYQGIFHSNSTKCLSVKEINKIKLQETLKEINSNLNNDILIRCTMMESLYQAIENYNSTMSEGEED